jgi:hypothetical protein
LEVCRIAEPNLAKRTDGGRSQVDEVAKQVIKEYRSHDDSFEISSWEGLIPNWKPKTNLVRENEKYGIRVKFYKRGASSRWLFDRIDEKQQKSVRIIFPSGQPFGPDD